VIEVIEPQLGLVAMQDGLTPLQEVNQVRVEGGAKGLSSDTLK
jgi:hypothetical protein